MTDKMVSFLKHINIENIDDFDIDFEMVGRNRFKREQIDMVIVKNTPWQYYLLRQFQDGLNTLTYPYLLRFSYIKRPDMDDLISLFEDWYQTIYRIPHNLELEVINDNCLKVWYVNPSEKEQYAPAIKDFNDFLNFLNYEFVIVEDIKPDEGPEISKSEMRKIEKKAEKEAEQGLEEESAARQINDRSEVEELIAKEKAELNEEVEDQMMKQMRANAREMAKDRERARLNKRGNYEPVDIIDNINRQSDHVDFSAKVFSVEINEYGDRKRLNIGLFDEDGGAIYANCYQNAAINDSVVAEMQKWGTNVRVRGAAYYDEFNKSMAIKAHFIDLLPPDEIEKDTSEKKRVELHLHSNMSTQDGITHMLDYAYYAKAMGHTAMAITDHAVVQGYPDAQLAGKKTGLKMLYGVEFNMLDNNQEYIFNPDERLLHDASYVVLDLETTGLSSVNDRITEFAAFKVEHGIVSAAIDILINPERKLKQKIINLTHITDKMLANQPTIAEALPKILSFIGDSILVTHNASFDFPFLQEALKRCGYEPMKNPVIDTLSLSRYLFPELRYHNLGAVCRRLDVEYTRGKAHRADYDARVLNESWHAMLAMLTKQNRKIKHCDLASLNTTFEAMKYVHPKHLIALAKNKEGLKSLYKLVSISHINHLAEQPKILRSEIAEYRKDLIIGSACFNGEVFETARERDRDTLKEVMKFYDYIEIQPLENYSYLINNEELDQDELLQYLKTIVECADELGIPVCATGDVHYLTRKHKAFRDVYISAKGIGGVSHPLALSKDVPPAPNPDQHYRSTDEMLKCMSWLGEEKAYEVTVTNTNMIADMIEPLLPVPNDKLYTPTIENCDNMLKDMCYKKAHELYGDPLPEYIEDRLKKELNGIISNGYSVIYYIAHKLIKMANDDGYIVGSRGSVGSSFVATMSNVTEVNPLPPHYRCPKCKHLEWTKETMPEYKSGYDLPEKRCPVCGEYMVHDGQDIPFETFLGFNAEKVPDIDLNFPGDYQATAHKNTKVLLGENNVFRAGTIETVADKTAFGFVRGYFERKFMQEGKSEEEARSMVNAIPKAKIAYLASGCVDVKRTTGQHPGGIVVIPADHEVYDFTPVQYPADDVDAEWKTTHFDFHSIHDTILKLDLLGHVDPMALKMMSDLTGVKLTDIPMNDPKVISLFSSAKALGMDHDYTNAKTGALALPEFNTEFVRGVLEETNPKSFSDLVIISGLTHGTGVWEGNAKDLVAQGKSLRDVIGCRDDIMTVLINTYNIPSNIAFMIMEDVRKGRGLKPEYLEIMKAKKVPDYYINSCQKIKYMFPKGHAVAYVTMAVRVGYFKIYYPLEFYATFFSVRSKQYDIQTMIKGKDAIISKIEELRTRQRVSNEKLSPKEQEQLKTLINALEMVQRGYKFSNIDLYRSDATKFVVDYDTKSLIPPFITIDGLGENNAVTVVEARKEGEFFSKEDLLRRTKLTSTNVQDLSDMGVLDDLSESDQLSLFDF